MGYLKPRGLGGCCGAAAAKSCHCGGQRPSSLSGLGALGSLGDPANATVAGAPSGVDPALYLKAHLNRYTAANGAPKALQFGSTRALPLTPGEIDIETAIKAVSVVAARARATHLQSPNAATSTLLFSSHSGFTRPIPYVTSNLAVVTDVVRLFADLNGLKPAVGVPRFEGDGLVRDALLIQLAVVGATIGFVMLTRKKR